MASQVTVSTSGLLWVSRLAPRAVRPGHGSRLSFARTSGRPQIQAQVQLKAGVHVYADGLSDDELRRALVIPCRSVEETIAHLRRQRPDATIAVLPDGPQVIPYVSTPSSLRGEG